MINKEFVKKRLNAYFFAMALALSVSAYLWLSGTGFSYVSKADILLTPENVKTSIYLDKAEANLVNIFRKEAEDDVEITIKDGTSIVAISVTDENKKLSEDLLQENIEKFVAVTGKYFDLKKDLKVEVVNRSVIKVGRSAWLLIVFSLIIGLFLSFLIQLFLEMTDKRNDALSDKLKKDLSGERNEIDEENQIDLSNVFNFDREKIRELTSDDGALIKKKSVPKEKKDASNGKIKSSGSDKKNEVMSEEKKSLIKTAFPPSNLPIMSDDEENNNEETYQKHEIKQGATADEKSEKERQENGEIIREDEPTEEEFKERLNQLLRGE